MIETPYIAQQPALVTAKVRLTIPRAEIVQVMGPAIGELMAAVAAQGVAPAGPLFSYHLRIDPEIFDFEICVPVAGAIAAAGRVMPGDLAAATVARTIYHGAYEHLGAAWGEFNDWIKANGYRPAPALWECYRTGPESSPNPADWRTELNRPLAD